ncbi:INSulin related [Caenorhabditis elegans]|uniref:INSulin related n=1 Tax=Caenorhabditis elegans TaxID=6239 RepID=Q9TYK2_CAEEL|nr:INSulin related [Caenorhabditis elegans]CCD71761.1 INSulin related [Caenorhabditis elegans]|eukprot:NP_494655.1 INSulin related [Caenorhabditis elegans]
MTSILLILLLVITVTGMFQELSDLQNLHRFLEGLQGSSSLAVKSRSRRELICGRRLSKTVTNLCVEMNPQKEEDIATKCCKNKGCSREYIKSIMCPDE